MSDLDLLRRLGDDLVPPPLDLLRETARSRDRRTAAATALVAGVAVAGIAAGVLLLTPDEADREPRPTETPTQIAPTSRPLTYADGATIHYGDRTVDAGGRVVELDLTDWGVAFRTEDGRIGFTDGSSVDQVGELGDPGPVYETDRTPLLAHDGWLVSAHTGSLVAWFEFTRVGQGWIVAYDTGLREVVSRTEIALDDGGALPAFVSDDYVYWYDEPSSDLTGAESSVVRYDPATGEQAPASDKAVQDDLRDDGPERTVLIGGEEAGVDRVTDGTDRNFAIEGGRVVPLGAGDMVATDGLTGQRFAFEAPPDYPRQGAAWVTQWRDDDTIVLLSALDRGDDLIECRVSTGTCEVVFSGPGSIVAPELG